MPNSKKKPRRAKSSQSARVRLARGLAKCAKAELIEFLVHMAQRDSAILSWLESELGVEKPSEEIVAETKRAIANATDFDDRDRNRNFDYDYESYQIVERNLKSLVDSGHMAAAMTLAEELMEQGSYQVEASDEGMMTQDIEQCLMVVIKALESRDTCSAREVIEWCARMVEKDRVGFICHGALKTLRRRIEA